MTAGHGISRLFQSRSSRWSAAVFGAVVDVQCDATARSAARRASSGTPYLAPRTERAISPSSPAALPL